MEMEAMQSARPDAEKEALRERQREEGRRINARARRRKKIFTGIRVALNVVMALFILMPLLYAVSIAFMPSGSSSQPVSIWCPEIPPWKTSRLRSARCPWGASF